MILKKIDQKNIFSTLEKANRLIQEYLEKLAQKISRHLEEGIDISIVEGIKKYSMKER